MKAAQAMAILEAIDNITEGGGGAYLQLDLDSIEELEAFAAAAPDTHALSSEYVRGRAVERQYSTTWRGITVLASAVVRTATEEEAELKRRLREAEEAARLLRERGLR